MKDLGGGGGGERKGGGEERGRMVKTLVGTVELICSIGLQCQSLDVSI